jgi:hypothetical protein
MLGTPALLVMEVGASSMIMNEARILSSTHHRTEGIRAVHPPCMLAMMCFYGLHVVGTTTFYFGPSPSAAPLLLSPLQVLRVTSYVLTFLPIVHGGTLIWSLMRSMSARARVPVRILPAPSESMFKWVAGWRGTAVFNVMAMMLSLGTSIFAVVQLDPFPALHRPPVYVTDKAVLTLCWLTCSALGLIFALNTLLSVRYDFHFIPTDESFRVNVALKVLILGVKGLLRASLGSQQTMLKSVVTISYIASLLITAWITLALQSVKALKYPEELRGVRRPRLLVACYAVRQALPSH